METIGTIKTVRSDGRVRIDRVLMGHSYARSGNATNPTPWYVWKVYVDGAYVGLGRNRRSADGLAAEVVR